MDTTACIDRNGIVEEVGEKSIRVRLTQTSCCGCSSKSICSTGKEDFIVDVAGIYKDVLVGEEVTVRMANSIGFKAIFLGYAVPFILVISMLFVTTLNGLSELIAGVSSIAILIPYYIVLSFFRNRLKQSLTFLLMQK